jgi:gamma-glutamylcyclotransferase (GGCT)/AIG2-like uncharacterized protein YtfP
MLLFVYGTLKREQPLHHYLLQLGAKFKDKAILSGYRLYTVYGHAPAIAREDTFQVKGELFEVPDDKIGHLDAIEYGYKRVSVITRTGKKLMRTAEAYVWNEDTSWLEPYPTDNFVAEKL